MKIKHGDYLHAFKKSKKFFVFADKTSNIYQIETDKYNVNVFPRKLATKLMQMVGK